MEQFDNRRTEELELVPPPPEAKPRIVMAELEKTVDELTLADFPDEAVKMLTRSKTAFSRSKLLLEIKAKAKELGFSGFGEVWKAYQRDQKLFRAEGCNYVEDLPTTLELPALEGEQLLKCGDWISDGNGVRESTPAGERLICPHPIFPIGRSEDIMTGQAGLTVAFSNRSRWRTVTADRSVLAKKAGIVEVLAGAGAAVTDATATALSRYLMEVDSLSSLPTKQTASRCGWHKRDNQLEFIPFVEDVELVAPDNAQLAAGIRQNGTISGSVYALRMARRSLPVRIAIAASFASVLVNPLHCLPFIVHLWSPVSGTGKTVALMGGSSVWGNPDALRMNFNTTRVALEQRAGFLNNLPMCVDELQLARRGDGAGIAYLLSEAEGRSRGRPNGGTRTKLTWQNTIVTTGESPLTGDGDGAGAVNRCISVSCGSEPLFEDGHAMAEALRQDYGFAGPLFLQSLTDGKNLEGARRLFNEYLEQLKAVDTTDKQRLSAAVLLTADNLAGAWVFGERLEDALQAEDLAPYLAPSSAVDVGQRALDYVAGWITEKSAHFMGRHARVPDGADLYGLFDNGGNVRIIKKVLDGVLESAGYSGRAVYSRWKAAGWIEKPPGNQRGYAVSLSIGDGVASWCIVLLADAVGNALNNYLNNDEDES